MQQVYISIKQQGSALLICIVLLLAVTFTAIAAVQSGIMQVRMAGALEDEMEAFQLAQSIIDYVLSSETNLPTLGAINQEIPIDLSGNAYFNAQAGEIITAAVTRTAACGPIPRMGQGFSEESFNGYVWKVSADVDKRQTRRGRSHQRQGYIFITPC